MRILAFLLLLVLAVPVRAETLTILAVGDSITAGLGLDAEAAFPSRLEKELREKGHDIRIVNGGVSGDTMADGLARLDWSLTPEVRAVIVALGANDALRGLAPEATEKSLDTILSRLADRRLPVLLAGLKAPRNLGEDYGVAYDELFARQASRHGVLYYPFLLDGVATDPHLNQPDGIHPNAEGAGVIARRLVPLTEALIARAGGK
jgi:acyl-CoA thioesterase-1